MKENENSQYEILKFKLIVVGDQNTGKSSILNRFANNNFDDNYQATIGLDFANKNVTIHDQEIRLILYDTAGQEKFRSLIPMYIREAQVILLIYDISNRKSFENIPNWFSEVLNVKNDEAVFALIGNKMDLSDNREVTYEEGKKLANEKNMFFEEMSAKTGKNIMEFFNNTIFEAIYKKFQKKFDDNKNIDNIDYNTPSTESNIIRFNISGKNESKIQKKIKCC